LKDGAVNCSSKLKPIDEDEVETVADEQLKDGVDNCSYGMVRDEWICGHYLKLLGMWLFKSIDMVRDEWIWLESIDGHLCIAMKYVRPF
jgi:hypothetical protein